MESSKAILAGDVGGTKSRLGLFSISKDKYHLLFEKTFPSKQYRGLEIMVKEFLAGKKTASACFGVAGPVFNGRARATNLPWVIDTKSLQKALGLQKVELINDLVANAYGISALDKKDFETLNRGKKEKAMQPSYRQERDWVLPPSSGTERTIFPPLPKAGMLNLLREIHWK